MIFYIKFLNMFYHEFWMWRISSFFKQPEGVFLFRKHALIGIKQFRIHKICWKTGDKILKNFEINFEGGHVKGTLQPYNHIKLSSSSVNRMKIKNLIRKSTITKCFSFYEKGIFDFATTFYGTILICNTFILIVWSII